MSKTFALIATAIVLTGCAGNSTQPSDGEDAVVSSAETSKPKLKCRYEKSTRSRLGTKVCERVSD